jgi:beta-N-acetylhexosaminidase
MSPALTAPRPARDPGPVLIGLSGLELTSEEADWLRHPATGGVVLFHRNYSDRAQLQALCVDIRRAADATMLICVDHEGGRVQRFRKEFTRLPPLGVLGRMHREAPELARDFAYRHGRVMATELLLVGVDLSFAPVLDLDLESTVIGDRGFSHDAEVVIELGAHYLAGMHDAGMRTCGKHFPGHGTVAADSHTHEAIDRRSLDKIRATDLRPFEALLGELDSLMMAHVVYPEIDPLPAGYSTRWLRNILREQLGYRGLVFSDDLGMQAARGVGDLAARSRAALDAGCDVVLTCDPADTRELLRTIEADALASCPRLTELAGACSLSESELASVGEWRHWRQSVAELVDSRWTRAG